jgi:hypothetical protein
MTTKKCLKKTARGWFPKEPLKIYATKPFKPRWKRPVWVALTLVAVVALGFAVYAGVQTYLRYSNPRLDVTSAYFEKTLNCTTAEVGDCVEVTVQVGWHGYVFPEFKREVKVVDQFPEDRFDLVGGSNTFEYACYGGSDQFTYTLRVIAETGIIELPEPKLYIDNIEITLKPLSC